jgi:protein-S-isoprenylcysteine O-methyltransferase Ste14
LEYGDPEQQSAGGLTESDDSIQELWAYPASMVSGRIHSALDKRSEYRIHYNQPVLSAYLVIGTLLEERKLVLEFGDKYREYQRQVSMFIPLKWRN